MLHNKLIIEALKIAIEAKLKKQKMYERNPEDSVVNIPKARKHNQSSDLSSIPSLPNISRNHMNNNSLISVGSMVSVIPPNKKNDKTFFITNDYLNMDLLNK